MVTRGTVPSPIGRIVSAATTTAHSCRFDSVGPTIVGLVHPPGDVPLVVVGMLVCILVLRAGATAVHQVAATFVALLSSDHERAERAVRVLRILRRTPSKRDVQG